MERREPFYTVGENVKWYSHYREQHGGSLKKLKIELPYDPAIPLLGIYVEKNRLERTCIPVFTAVLFTTAKKWKQPKCPSAEEWVRKMWYIHTMEHYSAIKKNEMTSAAPWMDPETDILSEDRETEISHDIPYMQSQKRNYTSKLNYKSEAKSQT